MSDSPLRYDVFLSYNRLDGAQAEDIALRLRARGLSVFLDKWCLPAGFSWLPQLESAMQRCAAAVIFLGPHGVGRWQQDEIELALTIQKRDAQFPVIPVLLPQAADPPLGFLLLKTWVDMRGGTADSAPQEMLEAAIRLKPPSSDLRQPVSEVAATICPYRGLRFFREEDAPFFFGRDTFVERLVGAVSQHTLVAVAGPSGCGKSSVIRAGLLPRLRERRAEEVWEVATMVPGDSPFHSLAATLLPLLEPQTTGLDSLLKVNELATKFTEKRIRLRDVVRNIHTHQHGNNRMMLVVDQWEELYRPDADESLNKLFFDEILDATESTPLSVVIAFRDDFYGRVMTYQSLCDRLQDAVVHVRSLTSVELKEVIRRPAEKVGLRFESGLEDRILADVDREPGKLSLLELALEELWKARRPDLLTHDGYQRTGGVRHSIATRANSVYEKLSAAEKEVARRIFLQLVRPVEGAEPSTGEDEPKPMKPTRRRVSFDELEEGSLPVIRKLAGARLIVTGRNEVTGEEIVDLVHEALIVEWDLLRDWIVEDHKFLVWRERLRALKGIGVKGGWNRSELLRGAVLAEAAGWMRQRPSDLGTSERSFIQTSLKEARRRKILWLAAACVSITLSLTLGVYLFSKDRYEGKGQPPPSNTEFVIPADTKPLPLVAYPAGNGMTAIGDATYTEEIPDNTGIALFNTSNPANFTSANRLDAVGSASEANTLYKEGGGYPPLARFSIDYSLYREICDRGESGIPGGCQTGGIPKDTDDNSADFIFVDTNGAAAGAGQRLGAPGPQSLSSPVSGTAQVSSAPLAPCLLTSQAPNSMTDLAVDAQNNSTFGTLSIFRTFTNQTGAPITRLRFRVADITAFPSPTGTADLRARSSKDSRMKNPCDGRTVRVYGTKLEEPPTQPNGGAFNSSLSVDAITSATPLAPGASITVHFLLGVQQTGVFRYALILEASPGANSGVLQIKGDTEGTVVVDRLEAAARPSPSSLIISEFRLRGPQGAMDEFIEIYNPGDADLAVSAADGSSGYALAASDGIIRFIIPNGTVIPARGHFLGVNRVVSVP